MHVCMIDENSHYSQPTEVGENNLFSLRKRAPIESLRQAQDCSRNLTARTSPSTFLFLLSSQCQRTDHSSVAAVNRHRKHQGFPYLVSNRRTRWLPSRLSCPVPKTAKILCFLFRKRTPIESLRLILRLPQEPNRKNLAVHVSLSSIFTMSKSGPKGFRKPQSSMKASRFQISSNQTNRPGWLPSRSICFCSKTPAVGQPFGHQRR